MLWIYANYIVGMIKSGIYGDQISMGIHRYVNNQKIQKCRTVLIWQSFTLFTDMASTKKPSVESRQNDVVLKLRVKEVNLPWFKQVCDLKRNNIFDH
jgi:hypothetical protein